MQRSTVLLPVPFSPSSSVHLRISPESSTRLSSKSAMERTSSIRSRFRNTVRKPSGVPERYQESGWRRLPWHEFPTVRFPIVACAPRSLFPSASTSGICRQAHDEVSVSQRRLPNGPTTASAIMRFREVPAVGDHCDDSGQVFNTQGPCPARTGAATSSPRPETPRIHTGITHTGLRPGIPASCASPASNVPSSPPRSIAVASSTASVTCRYPWIRARMAPGRSTIERSSAQNWCDSTRLSSRSKAIASPGATACPTTEGLHETRTNPASVSEHVAQPLFRCALNQERAGA